MKQQNPSFKSFLQKLPSKVVIGGILLYRLTLSPSVGILRFLPGYPKPSCIFHPTCSQYAIEVFGKYSFIEALKKTVNRIRRCHPGNEPQVDLP